MNREWSLKELYTGYEDEAFQRDMKKLEEAIAAYNAAVSKLDTEHAAEGLRRALLCGDEAELLAQKLYVFCGLSQAADTRDMDAASYLEKILLLLSGTSKADTRLEKFVAGLPEHEAVIASDEVLTEYAFRLRRMRENAKYKLGEEAEELAAKLDLSGGSAWSNLQSYLTSTVRIAYGEGEVTLSEIRNLAYDRDPKVRREAYEAELAGYEKIKDSVAFSLNSIKQQVLTMTKLRGYESPLDMTLKKSMMKRETLDAMLAAMKEYFPRFRQYLRRKGELLGHSDGLPWYELFAPMGESSRTFTTEEARDYLIGLFEGFAPDLAEMVRRAFDEAWIDFYPREGKAGGAFCQELYPLRQSRILTNFGGTLSDVVTLAHELGHAYHNQQIFGHRIGNTNYSMPVAETASTFNETVVMDAAIGAASGEEKIALIESQLQDVTQILCDIYSRYLFETAVFEEKQEGFLSADRLKELMLSAQKEAYGDGLDEKFLHPYMWVCKGHYYSSGLSFYNFPYAFGGLFARGLHEQYRREGEAFLPKYRALLNATPVSTVEEAALTAGIDLSSPEFFRSSLESYARRADEFVELTGGRR
ncbi:MAG: M3 family oligoendopeptidase [Lachnospiraceae bacterium]|nr:M3 family oligoendopeptidase [Lachnospiraceae bacterium]